MEIVHRVKELSKYGELITGDKKEKTVIEKIRSYFEELKIETVVHPQSVLSWKEEEIELECEGNKIEAISFPYSPSIDLETKEYDVVKLNNILEVNKYYRNSNKILIFTVDDFMRKIVIKEGKLLSHLPQIPPSIPAFYVRQKDTNRIKGNCKFYLKSKFEESIGYTIEAIMPGRSDEKIYVTAHHDHWFLGEHDDLVSVAILPELKSNFYELHLISFTAEESGCYFNSFSWGCGSYNFLRSNKVNAKVIISIDNLTQNSQFFVTPGFLKYFINSVPYPSPYTDSYNFLKYGMPTITISDVNYPYYHSENDILSENENFDNIIHVINNFLSNEKIEINKEELLQEVLKLPLPVEIKTLTFNLIEKGKYNELLRFYGSIMSFKNNKIYTSMFHKLLGVNSAYGENIIIEDFDELKNNCDTKECEDLYSIYLTYLQREFVKEYIQNLKNLF